MDIVEDHLTFWEKQLALLELWSFLLGTINGTIILNQFLYIRSFDFRGLIRKEMSLVIYPKSHWLEKYVKSKLFFYFVTDSGLVVRCIIHPIVELVYFLRFSHINSVVSLPCSFDWDMTWTLQGTVMLHELRVLHMEDAPVLFYSTTYFETTEWVSKAFWWKMKVVVLHCFLSLVLCNNGEMAWLLWRQC